MEGVFNLMDMILGLLVRKTLNTQKSQLLHNLIFPCLYPTCSLVLEQKKGVILRILRILRPCFRKY